MDGSNLAVALTLALLGLYAAAAATKSENSSSLPSSLSSPSLSQCKISEWKCLNGTCISASKFCDGNADCLDRSDEPNECSRK